MGNGHKGKTHPLKPFRDGFEAVRWAKANAKGPCSVLVPWEVWEWGLNSLRYVRPLLEGQ